MSRRPDGELEADVLRALWSLDRPASPGDVITQMQTDLAYTSIATVLGRLCDKGLAERQRSGRAFVYAASKTEADLVVDKIHTLLDATRDRASALAGLASGLDPEDAASLAALLNDRT
jgi:predicted transcriptional regulator